jgi:hypothetical protein
MSKIKKVEYEHDGKVFKTQYLYWCEGCGFEHAFSLKSEGGHHDFNMDLDNPTVSPSLLQDFVPGLKCHSNITGGKISYHIDCYHHLAGKTIELPEYPS